MVVDTSAIIAILFREPAARAVAEAIRSHRKRTISSASVIEASVVLIRRGREALLADLDLLLSTSRIEPMPVTKEQIRLAQDGFLRYGKGQHEARLNFGDCFSYALAKASGQPLLFVGSDFSKTDLEAVTLP